MHYGARYFSPLVGRFVSADTIVPEPGNPQAFNRYAYTLNNPVKYTDPTGYREVECTPGESGCDNNGQLLTPPSSEAPSLDGPLEDYSSVSEPITGSPGQSNNDWIDEFLANESKYGHRYCKEQHQCPVPIWQLDPDFVAELLGLVPVQTPSGMSFVLMAKSGQGAKDKNKSPSSSGGEGRPGSNVFQNKQFRGAIREIERQLGRRLSPNETRQLHESLHHLENPGFWDMVEEGLNLFDIRG